MIEKLKKRLLELSNNKKKIILNDDQIEKFEVDIHSNEKWKLTKSGILRYTDEFRDKNLLCIRAFPPFIQTDEELLLIIDYIKKNRKDENTLCLFDNLHEGHVLSPIHKIHSIIDLLNLDHTKIYFFTSGMEAHRLYDDYCTEKSITKKINLRVINVWENHIKDYNLNQKPEEPIYEVKLKEKLFLCFNRNARPHRIALLGLMYSKNLVDKGYYSFFPKNYGNSLNNQLYTVKSNLSDALFTKIEKQIQENEHKFPLLLNTTSINENINYVKSSDKLYYENSYFSIVTETFYFGNNDYHWVDEGTVFFSEKIFKPIICKHPFIQLNRPHALKYLKKLGYKTFHPYINESYDEIENNEDRLIAIVNEIERLSNFSNNDWLEWQSKVTPIIEHNYKQIQSKNIKEHVFYE